jgi:hypothetical protein
MSDGHREGVAGRTNEVEDKSSPAGLLGLIGPVGLIPLFMRREPSETEVPAQQRAAS